MYNKTIMVGNLTRDIELKYLPSGSAVAKSSIATSYKYKSQTGEQKEEVCFLEFNMFGRSAEVANQYLKKGSQVYVEGRLRTRKWTDQSGQEKYSTEIIADSMQMLGARMAGSGEESSGGRSKPAESSSSPSASALDAMDDDIPF